MHGGYENFQVYWSRDQYGPSKRGREPFPPRVERYPYPPQARHLRENERFPMRMSPRRLSPSPPDHRQRYMRPPAHRDPREMIPREKLRERRGSPPSPTKRPPGANRPKADEYIDPWTRAALNTNRGKSPSKKRSRSRERRRSRRSYSYSSSYSSRYLQACGGKGPKDNVFMSPSSMMVVMTMLRAGARNNTEDQMTKTLKLEKMEKKKLLQEMEIFVGRLKKGSESVTLSSANRLYPHVNKTILEEYLSLVSKHFRADVKGMNFTTEFEEARQEINKWVEGETNSKIKNLLPSGSLNPLTAMVVVNAIYFKGNWETQFEKRMTSKVDFTKIDGTKTKVDMMSKKLKNAKYGEDNGLHCKVLELAYVGKELGMIILLPSTANGLPDLEQKLTVETIRSLLSHSHRTTVDVSLPKFKLETSLQLKDTLSELGMPDLFDDDKADLSGMGKGLYVSQVYHKAFVDVNEEGTETAATTAAVVRYRCLPPPTPSFRADHPFLFMIWDHEVDVPLFIGRFIKPESARSADRQ